MIIISILLTIGIIIRSNLSYILPWNIQKSWVNRIKSKEEILVYDFINKKLSEDNYGIYTNYLKENSDGDITKGHDVLSESEGIIMLYAVEEGDKGLFNKHYEIVKESMITKDALVAWRKNKEEKSETSATIDDFRIIKALIYGYSRWGDFKYRKTAIDISNSIYKNLIVNNRVIDFKDEYGKAKDTTICYLDLNTMKLLSEVDKKWNNVYEDSIALIKKAKISKELPLYKKVYINEKNFFEESNDVDMLLSLITILNKIEASEGKEEISIKWIKKQFDETGVLCSFYDINTGKAKTNVESTAIYSTAAMIFSELGDKTYYNKMLKKLQTFQVKDKNSEVYGSFGNAETKQVYSFDNLNALLAIQRR